MTVKVTRRRVRLLALALSKAVRCRLRRQHVACQSLTDFPAAVIDQIILLAPKDTRLALFRQLRDAVLAAGAGELQTHLYLHTDVQQDDRDAADDHELQAAVVADARGHLTCTVPIRFQSARFEDSPYSDINSRSSSSNAAFNDILPANAAACLAAVSANKLLQLASRSAHDVNLHIRSSFRLGAALQQVKTQPKCFSSKSVWLFCSVRRKRQHTQPEGGSSSSSNDGLGNGNNINSAGYNRPWLSAVLVPVPHKASAAMSLQQITTMWLQDMVLEHPMPECIGHGCPGLRCYGLQNVTWPDTIVTRRWPQVQQLALQDICTRQVSFLFSPATLPQLSSLKLVWSGAYEVTQRAYQGGSAWVFGQCCHGFRNQLVSLAIVGMAWIQAVYNTAGLICPRLESISLSGHLGHEWFLPSAARAAPNLLRLRVRAPRYDERYKRDAMTFERLTHLHIDNVLGDTLHALSCLPPMPALKTVTLPSVCVATDILVGPDWLNDVAKGACIPVTAMH